MALFLVSKDTSTCNGPTLVYLIIFLFLCESEITKIEMSQIWLRFLFRMIPQKLQQSENFHLLYVSFQVTFS